jgi:hypothetical protein
MKIQFNENKDRYFKYFVIIYMLLYIIVGVLTFKDYGISVDERAQRNHSLVSYKYICEEILGRDLSGYEVFSNVSDIEKYSGGKYYGILLQLPFVAIEDIFDFSLQTRTIYLIRHLGTFCYCCLGFIFFYLFLKKVFKNRGYAFFGLVLISLYPRFYGEKFYNIKDLVFVAVCCLAYYGIALYLETGRKIKYGIIAGLFFAICTSSRMMGVMFPTMLVGYLLLQDIRSKAISKENVRLGEYSIPSWLKCVIDYCSIIVSYFAFWYLVTPTAWGKDVFKTFYEAFTYFGYYDGWNGTSLFAGQNLPPEKMPWHYLYTWIGITVPVYYIVLFFVGHAYWFKGTTGIKDWFEKALAENKYISLSAAMFWGPSFLVALHMIKVYNAWRHMYFIMCPFVVLAVYGLKFILEFRTGKITVAIKRVVVCLIAICMVMQVRWLYINHPYQQLYFNEIGKPIASQFDRDYWETTVYDLLDYILDNDDRWRITVTLRNRNSRSLLLLPDYEKARIFEDNDGADYYLESYNKVTGNVCCPEGYYEYYSIIVDGTKMGTVFKRK